MIQTVIFDMDGVIIDSEPVYFKIDKEMFEELNIAVSFEEHSTYVGTSSQNMWDAIIKKHGIPGDPGKLMRKEYNLYMDYLVNANDLQPIDGVMELINGLHENNFKLILASSSRMEIIDIILKKFKLSDLFIAKVSGSELAHSKPHPEIFLRSAQLAGSEPKECIVIEDSKNGVAAAKAAGMKCIGFLNPSSGHQNLKDADRVIQSFKELNADLVKKL
ncbi:MAG TPA: HAD family phosphatase [Chitinophagaceae bacterium]|nr:HAD family phosphatase [Chitinophagaceae bacterium]